MKWVCKIMRLPNQKRIGLPKGFLESNNLTECDHLVIDDRDPENITIRGFSYGQEEQGDKQAGRSE